MHGGWYNEEMLQSLIRFPGIEISSPKNRQDGALSYLPMKLELPFAHALKHRHGGLIGPYNLTTSVQVKVSTPPLSTSWNSSSSSESGSPGMKPLVAPDFQSVNPDPFGFFSAVSRFCAFAHPNPYGK
jgi:hypothetical protein